VGQLDTRRDAVLKGMQDGARRVFEIFAPQILGTFSPAQPSRKPGYEAFLGAFFGPLL